MATVVPLSFCEVLVKARARAELTPGSKLEKVCDLRGASSELSLGLVVNETTIPTGSHSHRAPLVAQTVKDLPAVREIWVRSLGWEDLEKGMATHSSVLTWRIPWTRRLAGYTSWGHKKSFT